MKSTIYGIPSLSCALIPCGGGGAAEDPEGPAGPMGALSVAGLAAVVTHDPPPATLLGGSVGRVGKGQVAPVTKSRLEDDT